MANLKELKEHFDFGKNWADFAQKVSDLELNNAKKGLLKLVSKSDLQDQTFLDVGCGSGLHSLAALNLGSGFVRAIDIDPYSVETTTRILKSFSSSNSWEVKQQSVFDLKDETELFDIVYSWGVLHHTGAMREAICHTAAKVKEGGKLILALYSKTLFCPLWRLEKQIYSKSPVLLQRIIMHIYISIVKIYFFLTGKNFKSFKRNYFENRGMNFANDVHDWLGGYPYESISLDDLKEDLEQKGFRVILENPYHGKIGFFGSGCFEAVFIKQLKI